MEKICRLVKHEYETRQWEGNGVVFFDLHCTRCHLAPVQQLTFSRKGSELSVGKMDLMFKHFRYFLQIQAESLVRVSRAECEGNQHALSAIVEFVQNVMRRLSGYVWRQIDDQD